MSLPVVITEYEGDRYLVAMLGQGTQWVANVRASGGRATLRHGRREPVLLEEVEPADRAPIRVSRECSYAKPTVKAWSSRPRTL